MTHDDIIVDYSRIQDSEHRISSAGNSSIDISNIDIEEITEDNESLSISAVLYYCKCKILRPYLRLLAVMGLRAATLDPPEPHSCLAFLGYIHLVQVLFLMCVGYLLQYLSCFRRDRGFFYKIHQGNRTDDYEQICYGSMAFSYIVPSILHLSAYIYAVYLFRVKENERLQNLMERVFLLSCSPLDVSVRQRHLVWKLWLFIALSIVWMILSLVSVNVMMAEGTIVFHWFKHSSTGLKFFLKIVLVISTLWHDMVQATLITSYCLQGQLLTSHLHFLRAKMLQHTIMPLDWVREIGEFQKLLKYLNEDFSPIVCFFTVVNVSWAASGIIWLLHYDSVDTDTLPITGISILNVILWILMSIAPFVQAARLSNACQAMQSLGHEVRGRPFVYTDTPGEDLDTILLYTSSLRMNSKLFEVPITGRYLCFTLTVVAIIILILGQCHLLQ